MQMICMDILRGSGILLKPDDSILTLCYKAMLAGVIGPVVWA